MSTGVDLSHCPQQDRLRLSLRRPAGRVDWWITRRLLLAWVAAWVAQLEAVHLPAVPCMALARNLPQEHALALEFDGPQPSSAPTVPVARQQLLAEVKISVQPGATVLVMRAPGFAQTLELTRQESHALLEMLARHAHASGWLTGSTWPDWLGKQGGSDSH